MNNTELINCPFCDSRPYGATRLKKKLSVTSCANSKCKIYAVMIPVDQWQARAELTKQCDELEGLISRSKFELHNIQAHINSAFHEVNQEGFESEHLIAATDRITDAIKALSTQEANKSE